jgi:prepilin-type N-terminal cleavage/methylation domain-containing protein
MNFCIDNVITPVKIVHVNANHADRLEMHRAGSRVGGGFSLVELLMVMGILSLLISTSVVALQSFNSAQRSTAAAYELASYLEMARSVAMARRTYVWVGLTSDTSQGRNDVAVGSVYSKDGTGSNVAASNLAPLARAIRLPNAKLATRGELMSSLQDRFGRATTSLASNVEGISFNVGPLAFSEGSSLTFTPAGEVLLKGSVGPNDGYTPFIDLCFRQLKGGQITATSDEIALTIDGSHGSVQILRVE